MTHGRARIVILISGRGSNMEAILAEARSGHIPVDVAAVISNRPDAPGLEIAAAAGVPVEVVDHRARAGRDDFDRALIAVIDRYRPDLVVLAGFMRILSDRFVDHYAGRLVNIHPALLPAFPGLDTHARALAAGARQHGATVHFVTRDVDAGPVIAQAAVAVRPDDTSETLAARVLEQEHRIYPLAIGWFAEGRLTLRGGEVLLDGARRPGQGILRPAE